jgi:hypothetical protein
MCRPYSVGLFHGVPQIAVVPQPIPISGTIGFSEFDVHRVPNNV